MADPIFAGDGLAALVPARSRTRRTGRVENQPQEPLVRGDAEQWSRLGRSASPPRARAGPAHGATRQRARAAAGGRGAARHLGRRAASGATRPHAVRAPQRPHSARRRDRRPCGRARPLAGDTDDRRMGHAGAARRPGRFFPRGRASRRWRGRAVASTSARSAGRPGSRSRGSSSASTAASAET